MTCTWALRSASYIPGSGVDARAVVLTLQTLPVERAGACRLSCQPAPATLPPARAGELWGCSHLHHQSVPLLIRPGSELLCVLWPVCLFRIPALLPLLWDARGCLRGWLLPGPCFRDVSSYPGVFIFPRTLESVCPTPGKEKGEACVICFDSYRIKRVHEGELAPPWCSHFLCKSTACPSVC